MPLSPLSPEPARPAHELLAAVRPRERAHADRPFVFVNMVATADGRAALEGSTRQLGSEADLELLLELRAIADAVLIGTGTVRAEGYARLLRQRGAAGAADRRRASPRTRSRCCSRAGSTSRGRPGCSRRRSSRC